MSVKQVLVVRKRYQGNIRLRRGKEGAQIGHGVMAWLQDRWRRFGQSMLFSEHERLWMGDDKSTKIVLQVEDEEGLLSVYNKAKESGLLAYLVTDSGATEFGGVPTNTVVAIGPNLSEQIDEVTSGLKLY